MNLEDFKNKYLGKPVEFHSFGGEGTYNQCVDLANQYIHELGLTPIIGTNAKDFPSKYDSKQFDWIPNTDTGVPSPGDLVIWNGNVGGKAGHIAIFLSGDVNRFTSLDQNWSKKELVTLENHNYSNVIGWLHPKGNMANELETCMKDRQKFWDERDELLRALNADSIEAGKSTIAGYKSRITDLSNQLGSALAEVSNKREEVSRLEEQLQIAEGDKKTLTDKLTLSLSDVDRIAREKGTLAIELEQAKVQIETLKQQSQQGEVTITLREFLHLLFNQKITIKK